MLLNEKHHAGILTAYYLALKNKLGATGLKVFRKGEQYYGERRGRRMAYRALRDGKELNYATYFAYGELLSTKGATDLMFDAGEKRVDESVTRCPWAEEFERLGCTECGEFYCKEIDASVVRGFNPYLEYELVGNIYQDGCCRFIYQDDSIQSGLFCELSAPADAKLDFNFHCKDVYHAFSQTVKEAAPQCHSSIMDEVKAYLVKFYGQEFMAQMNITTDINFESTKGQ